MRDTPNYADAFAELQALVAEIERGEISVDELSQKVERAAILVRICRTKLSKTEADVHQILKELGDADGSTEK